MARAGREEADVRRRRQAVERVRTFRTWLVDGSRSGAMPPIPRDADYALARDEGEPWSVRDHAPLSGTVAQERTR